MIKSYFLEFSVKIFQFKILPPNNKQENGRW